MKTLMFKKLVESYNTNCLLEVYTDQVNNTFAVGFVSCITDNELLLNLVNSYGAEDGFLLIRINDIYCINYATQYLKNIISLLNNNKSRQIEFMFEKGYLKNLDLFSEILQENIKNHRMTRIKLYNNTNYYGFIEEKDQDIIQIEIIDEYGLNDGISYIKMDDIEQVSFDGVDENRRFRIVKSLK